MTRQKEPRLRRLRNTALLLVVLPLILPLALITIALYLPYRIALYLLVWALWLPRGKDILLVYSDSPIWREYVLSEILPLVQERAVVLNWSEGASGHGGLFGSIYFAPSVAIESLTLWSYCFVLFDEREAFGFGCPSKIGNAVTENR
jgi:hypothetical protein